MDGRARPTDEAQRIISRIQGGNADVAVLTDTHLGGDEMDAMRGHLRGKGWGSEGVETEGGKGGVLVMWKEEAMVKVEKVRAKDRVPGRVVRVVLKELGSGKRMEVVGVYAACRERQRSKKEVEAGVWTALEEMTRGKPDVMIVGDLNAETQQALQRSERSATWQDTRLQKLIDEHGLTAHGVGRATYREVSEIDHVLTGPNAATGLAQAE